MKIFVISLLSATQRRKSISQQFLNTGQSFDFFDAIDGRKDPSFFLFNKYNEKKRFRIKGYPLTQGELGCFASHYLLWEKCIALNEPIVVIEDDAQLEPCFAESIKLVPELGKYGYVRLFVNGRKRKFTCIDKLGEHNVVQYHRGPGATRSYYITPVAAKKFIAAAQEWYLPVDDYMDEFWVNNVPCRGIMPGLVKNETEFDSDVGQLEKAKKTNRLTREIYSIKSKILRKWYVFRHLSKSAHRI